MLGNEADQADRPARASSLRRAATGRCGGECVRNNGELCGACRGGQEEGRRRHDEGLDFDFGDLGPPPSCPVLCRQKAMDFTAAKERKRAGFFGQEVPLGLARSAGPNPLTRVGRRMPTPTENCPLMM
ncbi:hypothetical protein PF005_g25400 [Phytophthora fragariae]|uniref:Uncharacterized protein n=2 Tax=Phytophthora TaxID=4783 RepID=A0A6A3W3J8_9STRA|nr:hypothetical protein PF003_g12856 [Phytophthora fragariae]KAE8983921.1 hypothetical protein PR002_g23110 [Phytophthora rubi]KAE8923635.1 hypothetical protein PF009_g26118 [Phytophthora fragariae]KAE8975994.1 hypothetical protein PF011_g24236 [Phytophthora fragariae]KAE8985217.1 hypothetical protein PR001_g22956 [Phytophthora rubi]